MRLLPGDYKTIYLRGLCFYYQGQTEMAKKHFKEALTQNPDYEKARVLFKLIGRLDQAKEAANKLFNSGATQEAIEAYTEALQLDEKNKSYNSILFSNRAACYMRLHDYTRALEDANRAVNCNPEYTKAYMRRANIHM